MSTEILCRIRGEVPKRNFPFRWGKLLIEDNKVLAFDKPEKEKVTQKSKNNFF